MKFPEEFPLFRRNPKWDRKQPGICYTEWLCSISLEGFIRLTIIFFQKLLLMTMLYNLCTLITNISHENMKRCVSW